MMDYEIIADLMQQLEAERERVRVLREGMEYVREWCDLHSTASHPLRNVAISTLATTAPEAGEESK